MTTMNDIARQDRLAREYGVQESGMPVGHEYHEQVSYDNELTLAELKAKGGRITRVRILQEGRYCDISYVHATLPDGTTVPVRIDMDSSTCIPRVHLTGELIAWARMHRVFAKGLGLLDQSNWSVLRG